MKSTAKEMALLKKATKSIEKHNYTENEVKTLVARAISAYGGYSAETLAHFHSKWWPRNRKKQIKK